MSEASITKIRSKSELNSPHVRPRTDYALRHCNRLSEKIEVPQSSNLAEIQIWRESKIDHKTNESRPTGCDSKPEPTRPEIRADESDNPKDD